MEPVEWTAAEMIDFWFIGQESTLDRVALEIWRRVLLILLVQIGLAAAIDFTWQLGNGTYSSPLNETELVTYLLANTSCNSV